MVFPISIFQRKWSIRSILFWGEKKLKKFQNPRLESEVLLAEILNVDRSFLKKSPEKILTRTQTQKFQKSLRRRKRGVPVAYIFHKKIWNDLEFFISPSVLIPRDETEVLAEKIWKSPRDFSPEKILDIGTGSGCLALFFAKKFPTALVTATDISPAALRVAKKNAETHRAKINFLESDLLEKIPAGENFDLIVANLPYVPTKMPISREVRREPRGALFSGADGLDHLRKLRSQLSKIQFREIWLEFLPQQADTIKKIFAPGNVEFFPDLGGDIFFAKITP
jgi:release factor glutamine methyltransferase